MFLIRATCWEGIQRKLVSHSINWDTDTRETWPSPMWHSAPERVQPATTVNGTLTQLSLQMLGVLHCSLSHTFTQLPTASFLQTAEQTPGQMTVLHRYNTHTSETEIFFSSIAILRDHCCVCGLCLVKIIPDLCINNTWSSVWNNMISTEVGQRGKINVRK